MSLLGKLKEILQDQLISEDEMNSEEFEARFITSTPEELADEILHRLQNLPCLKGK